MKMQMNKVNKEMNLNLFGSIYKAHDFRVNIPGFTSLYGNKTFWKDGGE